jgi:hypothetical protein
VIDADRLHAVGEHGQRKDVVALSVIDPVEADTDVDETVAVDAVGADVG